jgi:hypothetical protein
MLNSALIVNFRFLHLDHKVISSFVQILVELLIESDDVTTNICFPLLQN